MIAHALSAALRGDPTMAFLAMVAMAVAYLWLLAIVGRDVNR